MQIIIHRINKISEMAMVPKKYGVEIDIRGYGDKMFLNHEPIDDPKKYDELEEYLKNFKHAFIIFNLKEAGYEERVIALAKKYGIKKYFLLDVEFPYLYRATRKDRFRKIAVRYSEAEPIESVLAQYQNGKPLLDWVWIDTNTNLPLSKKIKDKLKDFQTCLVCPDRWGRPEDIAVYAEKMRKMNFHLDAVMTALRYAETWEKSM
ncbi:MAG: hypothetical protein M0P76_03165 [Candidatus Pacebacteria bacterium]|nr:hypothetical protein [Candidatus Paceibacterota bacterium]